jgi:homoserine kinase type II
LGKQHLSWPNGNDAEERGFWAMMTIDAIRDILNRHYDLGRLVRSEFIDRGYINLSYELGTVHNGQTQRYILRRYWKGKDLAQIKLEHALLLELRAREFDLTPVIIPTRTGRTYVERRDPRNRDRNKPIYLAVFSFLEGEENYRWDCPKCTELELDDAARVLAEYHSTIHGWIPPGEYRSPTIVRFLSGVCTEWSCLERASSPTVFENYLFNNKTSLLHLSERLSEALPQNLYDTLPHLVIHGDYHPGNLKFQEGRVVGQFDFDWANFDARCFDVALALSYFCSIWDGFDDGKLALGKVAAFLGSYQGSDFWKDDRNLPGPLTEQELALLPDMIQASVLFVLSWTVSHYFATRPSPKAYLRYLRHSLRLAQWLDRKKPDLAALVMRHHNLT